MTNWKPESIEQYRDVQTIWNYHHTALNKTEEERLQRLWRSSRDNARTPVQWSGDKNAGFTRAETPWMDVNPNYVDINVEQQNADPDSVLNFYRKTVKLRKQLSCVRHGTYREFYPLSDKLYVYAMEEEAQKILVLCSFHDKEVKCPTPEGFQMDKAKLILCNYPKPRRTILRPYECKVYLWNK